METNVKSVQNVANISAREALECMKKSIYLSMRMDIKTAFYLKRMNEYKKYCMIRTRNEWCKGIYGILLSVNDRDLDELEDMLNCYEAAGKLLKRLQSESLEEVVLSYREQDLESDEKAFIELLILVYSEYGLEFEEALAKIELDKQKGGRRMKITPDTTVEEVKDSTKNTFYAMCADRSGMSKAEEVMDNFMEKLNNDEFSRRTEPYVGEEFVPSDEEAERILAGYHEILEEIKELKLK